MLMLVADVKKVVAKLMHGWRNARGLICFKCLENEGITQFPHETRSNEAGVILTTKTAALHCLCRKAIASKKREKMAR